MPIEIIGKISAPGLRSSRSGFDAPAAPAPEAGAVHAAEGGEEALARAIDAVNKMLDPMARGLQFSVDGSTGKTVVKLVDKQTNEVLREMPSREMLAIARALDRMQGLLFDGHA
jgi:flagellar protein FlaG